MKYLEHDLKSMFVLSFLVPRILEDDDDEGLVRRHQYLVFV